MMLLLFYFAILLGGGQASLTCVPSNTGTTIPIGVFHARGGHDSIFTPEVEPAVNVALDHIHNQSCILDGYKLQLTYKDTQCKTSTGMKALFDVVASMPRPVAIFGGVCTEVNEPIAAALKYWQIAQLSYAETHPKFGTADSSELYPTFFRIVPGRTNLNLAKTRLVSHFKWKRIGTVKQADEPRYALPHETLTTRFEEAEVKVVYTAGVTWQEQENIGNELSLLKARDVRIILADVAEELLPRVMCGAESLGMTGKDFVWILPGYHSTSWISKPINGCTEEQLLSAIDGHFAVQFATQRSDLNSYVVGGKKAGDIIRELTESCGRDQCSKKNIFQGYVYDGLWALAIALKEALGNDAFSHTRLIDAIANSKFEGVTGQVRFEKNERLGIAEVLWFQNGSYHHAAHYDGARDEFRVADILNGWQRPEDAPERRVVLQHVSSWLFGAVTFFASLGCLLALLFLALNIKYRNHRFIKMSSPNMNNLIILGSMCTFISVVLVGVDTRLLSEGMFVKMCYAKTWTLCLGFTLAFGAMFAKTWRVHSIFTNIRMDKKAIKDSRLLLMQQNNVEIEPKLEYCDSRNSLVFQAILFAVKGVLMMLGCFLAWETRHVNVPALNDSKYIGMSVYIVVVMSTLGVSIAFILQERVNESFAMTSLFVVVSTALTLCLVFVPKMVELVRNPAGIEQKGYRRGLMKSVVSKAPVNAHNPSPSYTGKETEKDLLARAEAENQLKQRYLHQKTCQLWELLERLRELGDTQFLQQGGPKGRYMYLIYSQKHMPKIDTILIQYEHPFVVGE
ncbi:unnamed protein product, partial [Mesorhabditis spiculigera]